MRNLKAFKTRLETAFRKWVVNRIWFMIPLMILLVIIFASGIKNIEFSRTTKSILKYYRNKAQGVSIFKESRLYG